MGGLASDMLCGVRIGGKVAKEGGGGAPQILAPFKRPRRFGGRRSRNRDPHPAVWAWVSGPHRTQQRWSADPRMAQADRCSAREGWAPQIFPRRLVGLRVYRLC